jgi:subtilisin
VDRIDAEKVWSTTTADTIKVAVVDSGIDLDHPDLSSNIKGGINTISSSRSADDDNGHGSHVAGIIAALNNSTGVVGVGHRIDLYAVKVLNRNGSGDISDIIEGIQWSINNGMAIINMSLGTSSDIQSFHDAVIAAKNAGVVVVAAAGNSGPSDNTVIYPARYPQVIAVSAVNSSNNISGFSSRGPEVDLTAPGESIYSTYRSGGYRTMSGTSMASPHVAGAAALVLSNHPGFTPDQVQTHLMNNAELLNGLNSNQQGAGLVDAEKATLTP